MRRGDRLRRASKLPAGKTWDAVDHDRASVKLRQQLEMFGEGDFVDHGVSVPEFSMPGTGKFHAICAIGHRLVESARSVLFIPAYRLVQSLPRRRPTGGYARCEEGPAAAQNAQEARQLRAAGDR